MKSIVAPHNVNQSRKLTPLSINPLQHAFGVPGRSIITVGPSLILWSLDHTQKVLGTSEEGLSHLLIDLDIPVFIPEGGDGTTYISAATLELQLTIALLPKGTGWPRKSQEKQRVWGPFARDPIRISHLMVAFAALYDTQGRKDVKERLAQINPEHYQPRSSRRSQDSQHPQHSQH